MEADYVSLSECEQEVKFLNILLEEISEVQKPEFFHEDNKGDMFLENIRKLGMHTKYIDIRHPFLKCMAEENDINIKYIRRKLKRADIMTKNCFEADHAKHAKIIMEGEL